MHVLVITEESKAKIKRVMDYADKHPYTMDMLFDIHNNVAPSPGDIAEYRLVIPVDFTVVYTVELQKFTVKHMSVSINGLLPPPEAAKMIMKEFGFPSFEECFVKIDELSYGHAINVTCRYPEYVYRG